MVGTTMDQPIIPNNPKPAHTLFFSRCACNFRSSLSPTTFSKELFVFCFSSLTLIFSSFENYAKNLFPALPSHYGRLFPVHQVLSFLFLPALSVFREEHFLLRDAQILILALLLLLKSLRLQLHIFHLPLQFRKPKFP